jgi:hypothetical protein
VRIVFVVVGIMCDIIPVNSITSSSRCSESNMFTSSGESEMCERRKEPVEPESGIDPVVVVIERGSG